MKIHHILLFILICLIGAWFVVKQLSRSKKIPVGTTLIVGTEAGYPPFSFIKDDEIVGFDIDVAKEVCRRLGKEMELQNMAFTSLIPALQLGRVHMVAAGLTATPERAKRVLFTQPYLANDELQLITVAEKFEPKVLEDLTGKQVAVNEGFIADLYLSAKQGPILQRLATVADGFLALKSGHVDAFVTARTTAEPFFKLYGREGFHVTTLPDTGDSYSLAISKNNPELLPMVEKVLAEMQHDGTLDKLKEKWKLK